MGFDPDALKPIPPKPKMVRAFLSDFIIPYLTGEQVRTDSLFTLRESLGVADALLAYFEGSDWEDWKSIFVKNAEDTEIRMSRPQHGEIMLLLSMYNLLASTHDDADRSWLNTESFLKSHLIYIHRNISFPSHNGERLTRHRLLEPGLYATKAYTRVILGNISTDFTGRTLPAYVRLLSRSEQVQIEERSGYVLTKITQTEHMKLRLAQQDLLTALLNYSPLTRWLMMGHALHEGAQLFRRNQKYDTYLAAQFQVLEDPVLTKMIVDHLLEVGIAESGKELARGLLWLLRRPVPGLVLKRMMELSAHILLMGCWLLNSHPNAVATRELKMLCEQNHQPPEDKLQFYAAAYAAHQMDNLVLPTPTLEQLSPGFNQTWKLLLERLRKHDIERISQPLVNVVSRKLSQR